MVEIYRLPDQKPRDDRERAPAYARARARVSSSRGSKTHAHARKVADPRRVVARKSETNGRRSLAAAAACVIAR